MKVINSEEIRSRIELLRIQYRNEMSAQNQQSSLTRSYREADRIKSEIQKLETQLKNNI